MRDEHERNGAARAHTTLVDCLTSSAESHADRDCLVLAPDGEEVTGCLSFGDLDERARAVGAALQDGGVSQGPALLPYARGFDFVTALMGCFYAGVVAVPVHLPRPNRSPALLRAIAADARSTAVLTTSAHRSVLEQSLGRTLGPAERFWLNTDEVDSGWAGSLVSPKLSPESLAFLQYTSGSTTTPRGVMVSHGNLMHNLRVFQSAIGDAGRSCCVSWLPHYHDMGLIGGMLRNVYAGTTCILMEPTAFLQSPVRWLRAISRFRAGISGGPNFAYELCVRKVAPEQCADLDLSCWELAANGGEPVRPDTLERFAAAFAGIGFRREALFPCYGLAEATVFVTGGGSGPRPTSLAIRPDALEQNRVMPAPDGYPGAVELSGCGRPGPGDELVIVDPESLNPCPDDRIGEVWVRGPSIARGYWNRPVETERTFGARCSGGDGEPFLRTGDLGFLHDGQLFVTGRLKDLVIVRGRNLYPHDIELTVGHSHPSLSPEWGAAFTVAVDGEDRLVVVHELVRNSRRGADLDQVVRSIRQRVVESHDLSIHALVLVRPGGIPRTTNGKIRRTACRDLFRSGGLDSLLIARRTPGLDRQRAPCRNSRRWDNSSGPRTAPLRRPATRRSSTG